MPALTATVGDFNHDGNNDVVREGTAPVDSAAFEIVDFPASLVIGTANGAFAGARIGN